MFYSVNKALKNRLDDAIHTLRNDIKNFSADKDKVWKENAEDALKEADKCVTEGVTTLKINSGWNYLHIAEQYMVRCMDDSQIQIKGSTLLKEASKISGWRKEQIYLMLEGAECKLFPIITADLLIEAMKLRNDFYSTRNHKMALHKSSVNGLTITLVIIITLIFSLSFIINLPRPESLTYSLLLSGLFGTLGASFSMAYSLSTSTLESKIPEQLLGISVTIIRLANRSNCSDNYFYVIHNKVFR